MHSRGLCKLFVSTALPLLACQAHADTIVLKNGRRIVGMNVVEQGDKVRYTTSAGELILPRSIVDHVERDGSLPGAVGSNAEAARLTIAPPELHPAGGSGEEIAHAAVHDGFVDREYIAKCEGEARGGTHRAKFNAALAHHAASAFELSQGDIERSLSDERTALNYAPNEPALLINVAYIYLRRSEFKQSLDYLERARRLAPEDPEVPKLEGWAYYSLSKLEQAVEQWKKALALRPDDEVRAALDKALRDQKEEESYTENESSHFTLRYKGTAAPALARDVLHTLESHFSAIELVFNYAPPDSIGVILYTQQAFQDITRAPGWASAINDGRIRVPVEGLTAVNQELSRVLKHELTHSFVKQRTHGRASTWIQEGLAQWMEGQRSREDASALVQSYHRGQATSLSQLEGSWMGFAGAEVQRAYAWALACTEYLVESGGMDDIERILDRLSEGMTTEAALREVTHGGYDDLMQSTAEFLRKKYHP